MPMPMPLRVSKSPSTSQAIDITTDFKGAAVAVTLFETGSTFILAEHFDPTRPYKGLDVPRTRGDDCPAEDT
jgi:hypothetical protein